MKRLLYGFAISLTLHSLIFAEGAKAEHKQEFEFSEDGFVRLQLSSGDYIIRAGQRDHVVIRWSANDPAGQKDINKIKVRTNVVGNTANIRTEGPTKHARIVIEIPARSDLYLRVRAGDVRIAGIDGNKD